MVCGSEDGGRRAKCRFCEGDHFSGPWWDCPVEREKATLSIDKEAAASWRKGLEGSGFNTNGNSSLSEK